jgi:hypothetical protein
MKNLFTLFVFLLGFSSIHAQLWDGGGGDNDWNNHLNWDTDMVPIAGALVDFNTTVEVMSTGAVVPPAQIRVRGAGTMLTLNLDVMVGNGLITEHAILINANAQLIIPSGKTLTLNAPSTHHGIVNGNGAGNAALTVNAGGTINILFGNRGINIQNSTFVLTNNGTINIGATNIDGINLALGATFNNNGALAIGATGQDGIDNSGTFNNNGTLAIGATNKDGIDNLGNFNNDGSIIIASINRNGINNQTSGTFNNNGSIEINDLLNTTIDGIFSSGIFNNQTLGVIVVGDVDPVTDDAVDALAGTFTNIGTMSLAVNNAAAAANVGLSIGSTMENGNFINNGIIEIDGGANVNARAVFVYPGALPGATTLTNNGLITVSNGNPNTLFFTRGTTVNGPTGTINTGAGRLNVNAGSFQNNGLVVSNYPMAPGVFTGSGATTVNDGFFRTNSSSFSNGIAANITNNGINMNDPAQTTIDLANGCDVTIGGAGATQIWENIFSNPVGGGPGPNLTFMNAFPDISSATINASGIDVSLTLTNLCAAALPIELTTFTAVRKEKSVLLEWETAGEINNDYMAVERSGDAKFFTEIGKKEGAGNSNTTLRYQLEDMAPLSGINYYRLRQVDYDGTINYSKIISVNFNGTAGAPTIALYPNVVKKGGSMEIDLVNFPSQQMTFRILNSQGQIVNNVSLVGGTRQSFEPGNLAAGIYFLVNTNSATKTSTRFVVTD